MAGPALEADEVEQRVRQAQVVGPELELADGGLVVLGSAAGDAAPIRELLERSRGISRATVIVGPEGGLTEVEERDLVSKGAVRVRAGPGTLRVETAVVVLVSLVASLGA